MLKTRNDKLINIGLLILRVGLGIMFILHGYPKMFGGPEMWEEVGTATQYLGLDFAPMFFGFIIGVTEFFGGIFLFLGLFFQPSIIMMFLVMVVATAEHIGLGNSFDFYSQTIELAIVFISLIFLGPGEHSLDRKIAKRARRRY